MELLTEIEKNFPKIENFLTKENLFEFVSTPVDDLKKYNDFGLGTMIRLKMLSPKNVLYRKFIQYGIRQKYDMSMEIIKAYHKYCTALYKNQQ